MPGRIVWAEVLARGRDIVTGYDTPVTLRQLFYRLVADGWIDNSKSAYNYLSLKTANGRRRGTFPELADGSARRIHGGTGWNNPGDCINAAIDGYRRVHAEYQDYNIWIGCEKATMVEQLVHWFGDDGIKVVAFGGYSSHTYLKAIVDAVKRDGRPAVLLYAGDFDPEGIDILEDFEYRTHGAFHQVQRIALNDEQIGEYDLPESYGKPGSTRAPEFVRRYGRLVQVELEALDPDDVHDLFDRALEPWWNETAFDRSMKQERQDMKALQIWRDAWAD
jgi:hypothetical protein